MKKLNESLMDIENFNKAYIEGLKKGLSKIEALEYARRIVDEVRRLREIIVKIEKELKNEDV